DDGIYYWRIKCWDNASLSGYSDYRVIKIDTASPAAPFLIYPGNNDVLTEEGGNTPEFEWTTIDDFSGVLYTVEVYNETHVLWHTETTAANKSQPSSSLPDNDYYWRVGAVDNAGNIGNWSEVWKVTIATGSVTITLFEINSGGIYTTSPIVTLTIIADEYANLMCFSNDGVHWSGWETYKESDTWDITNVNWGGIDVDGVKTVYVRCTQTIGGINSTKSSTITLDRMPPTPSLLSPENDVWINNNSVNFTWKTFDLTSGLNGTYILQVANNPDFNNPNNYSVSGSTENNISSDYTLVLDDGIYYWRIKCWDNAGLSDYSEYWKIKIDTTPPSKPVLLSPENDENVTLNETTFTWENSNDFSGSGIAFYEMQIDDTKYIVTECTFTLTLTDTVWYWKVRAVDNATNTGSWSDVWSFTVDTGGPKNILFLINGGANETSTEQVYLNIYAERTTEICFSNDGSNWSEWEEYKMYKGWDLTNVSEGEGFNRIVYLKCRYKQKVSIPVSDTIFVNKQPPLADVTDEPGLINVSWFVLHWKTDFPALVEHYEVSKDFISWENVGKNISYNFTGLDQGPNMLYVRAWNKTTEYGGVSSLSVVVDTLPPVNLFITTDGYTNSTEIMLTLHAEDNRSVTDFVSNIYMMRFSNNGVNWSEWTEYNESYLWNITNISCGGVDVDNVKTIYFEVMDWVGNTARENTTTTLDRVKPTNLSISLPDYTNSQNVALILNATDELSGCYLVQFRNKTAGSWGIWSEWLTWSGDGTYSYTLPPGDGDKVVEFRVKDWAGNIAEPVSKSTILDLTKPEFISLTQAPLNLTEDFTYVNISVTITEENLGANILILIYWVDGESQKEVSMHLLPGKKFYYNLSLDFNASQGNYLYYKIRCSDLAGNTNVSLETAEYIDPLPDVPELKSPSDSEIVGSNTTLKWDKNVTDPGWYFVEYLIEYDDDINFTSPTSYQTNATQIQIFGLAHNTTYYWHVRALNITSSPWSQTWEFTVKLPDLCIAQITFEPSDTIPVETTVLINVIINNIGENDAVNFSVSFYKGHPHEIGSTWIDTITGLCVGKGENVTVPYSIYQSSPEKFSIWVWIDSDNKIVEIKEENNLLSGIVEFVSPLDVLPTNITFSVNGAVPPYIFEKDTVTITAEIINLGGNIKIPFQVEFWFGDFENNTFNGSFIGKAEVKEILTGKTGSASIIWDAEVGDYKIWVFLNTTNLPNENIENNWFNKTFRVYPPTAVTISPSPNLLTTDPSGTLSYTITITNIGQISDTYNLSVEDLPSDWDYSFIYNGNEISNVTLDTGETIKVLLRVKSSDKLGTYHFRVVASSQKDPRAVYDTELTAKIKEPFPWYLVIIAVIAAAVIAVIGLMVKKGVLVVKGKPEKVKVEQGYNYLIKGTDVRKAYAVFIQLMKKTPGLCITSTHPRKIRDGYKLECPVYWLTDVTKTDEKTLHPERLDFELFKTVNDFVTEKHGVIMLDGLEYLIHVNGFERAMDFIDSIRDAISTHKGTLVVPANPSVFKEEELGMLEKRFDRILG
ncbi:MAG: DUF835 domain-containing protein, partial [Candidatus Thermoplasmatota archaeon]|nr:DUF835 domain-containing protein [Candidatus Thermoplasmatota archaeon]